MFHFLEITESAVLFYQKFQNLIISHRCGLQFVDISDVSLLSDETSKKIIETYPIRIGLCVHLGHL